jgi:hypothetical protein
MLCHHHVRAFWNLLLHNERLSSLVYTGQFFNKLTVYGYEGSYSVMGTCVATGDKRKSTEAFLVGKKVFCIDGVRACRMDGENW